MSIAMWNKLNERDELMAEHIKQLDARVAALEKNLIAVSRAVEQLDKTDKPKGK